MSKPAQFDNWPDALQVHWEYRAVVDRIVDGDTLYVFVDLGLKKYAYESVRLSEVAAPELYSGTDRVAGAHARDHLAQICPTGTKVLLVTEKDRDSFNRYLGWLLRSDGTWVNDLQNEWLVNYSGA